VAGAALCWLGAVPASALEVDLDIVDVVEGPTPQTSSLPDLEIDPSGDLAWTSALSAGNVIALEITVANPEQLSEDAVFLTVVTEGEQLVYLGATNVATAILEGGTTFNPTQLNNVGTGQVKVNSPVPNDGSAGELWVQGLAYLGSGFGTEGTGPDVAVRLLYSVTGVAVEDPIDFRVELTAGDAVSTPLPDRHFSGATLNPELVPGPGAPLVIVLGLFALSQLRRASD
jgi:hypothetical protein